MKYEVRYSRTDRYLVTVEARTAAEAVRAAENMIGEYAGVQRDIPAGIDCDLNAGELDFEAVELVTEQ